MEKQSESTTDHRSEIANRIEEGTYSIFLADDRNPIGKILDQEEGIIKGYVWCTKCRIVLQNSLEVVADHKCCKELNDPLAIDNGKYENSKNLNISIKEELDSSSTTDQIRPESVEKTKADTDKLASKQNFKKVDGKARAEKLKHRLDTEEKIENGLYTLTAVKGKRSVRNIFRRILKPGNQLLEGYVFCLKCRKVFCDLESLHCKHRCYMDEKSTLKKNGISDQDEEDGDGDRNMERIDGYLLPDPVEQLRQILNQIEKGVYHLDIFKGNCVMWETLRVVRREDNKIVDGVVYCTKCQKVYRRWIINHHACYRHYKQSNESDSDDPKDENSKNPNINIKEEKDLVSTDQRPEGVTEINADTSSKNNELTPNQNCRQIDGKGRATKVRHLLKTAEKIESGLYTLTPVKGKRVFRNIFRRILKSGNQLLEGYVFCVKCRKVFSDIESLYCNHRCYLDEKSALKNGCEDDADEDNANMERIDGYVLLDSVEQLRHLLNQVEKGIYHLDNYKGNCVLWETLRVVRRQDNKIVDGVVYCTKCQKVIRRWLINHHTCYRHYKKSNEEYKEDEEEESDSDDTDDPQDSKTKLVKRNKRKIVVNIRKGIYKLAKDSRTSVTWKLMRHILTEDGTPYKGYVYCIQCRKVYVYNKKSSLHQHKCCKNFKQLETKEHLQDIQEISAKINEDPNIPVIAFESKPPSNLNRFRHAHIIEKIKNGTYTLEHIKGRGYMWKLMRDIVQEDKTPLKGLVFCTYCQNVYSSNRGHNITKNKCFMALKESFLRNIGDDVEPTTVTSEIVADTDQISAKDRALMTSIGNLISTGVYTLSDRKKYIKLMWNFMQEIKTDKGIYLEDYIYCHICKKVFRFIEDSSFLYRYHKCASLAVPKWRRKKGSKSNQKKYDHEDDGMEEDNFDHLIVDSIKIEPVTLQENSLVQQKVKLKTLQDSVEQSMDDDSEEDQSDPMDYIKSDSVNFQENSLLQQKVKLEPMEDSEEFQVSVVQGSSNLRNDALRSNIVYDNPADTRINSDDGECHTQHLPLKSIKTEPIIFQENSSLQMVKLEPLRSSGEAIQYQVSDVQGSSNLTNALRSNTTYDNPSNMTIGEENQEDHSVYLPSNSTKSEAFTFHENSTVQKVKFEPLEDSEKVIQLQVPDVQGSSKHNKTPNIVYSNPSVMTNEKLGEGNQEVHSAHLPLDSTNHEAVTVEDNSILQKIKLEPLEDSEEFLQVQVSDVQGSSKLNKTLHPTIVYSNPSNKGKEKYQSNYLPMDSLKPEAVSMQDDSVLEEIKLEPLDDSDDMDVPLSKKPKLC
ncbi:uncharacterized protein LOC142222323 [Haematobia irritans]|uniref:uncharacterized protein LOC142222323 n=1 Tax=Haematobia irritans TaxID=7368 RepID=UPI003F4FBC4D